MKLQFLIFIKHPGKTGWDFFSVFVFLLLFCRSESGYGGLFCFAVSSEVTVFCKIFPGFYFLLHGKKEFDFGKYIPYFIYGVQQSMVSFSKKNDGILLTKKNISCIFRLCAVKRCANLAQLARARDL